MWTSIALLATLGASELVGSFDHAAPDCPADAKHCFGLDVFVVVREGKTVQTPRWLADEIAHANELFAPIDVAFELDEVVLIGEEWAHLHSRLDRDRLGRRPRDAGDIHIFMVEHLDDVDVEGNRLYGVHWRDRGDIRQRWIILSAKDGSSTALAHEMGHYFGLPHSRYRVSIMNKTPRERPTWPERVFAPPELNKMRSHRDRMVESGFLRPRAPGSAQR